MYQLELRAESVQNSAIHSSEIVLKLLIVASLDRAPLWAVIFYMPNRTSKINKDRNLRPVNIRAYEFMPASIQRSYIRLSQTGLKCSLFKAIA